MTRQMTDEASQLIEQIEQAQDIIDHVRHLMEHKRGYSAEAKRADDISGQIYELVHMMYHNTKTWRV